jgi:hypothetical protein
MKIYRNLVIERIRYALAAARAAQPLEHSGVKGAIREVLMADLFRPLLPADLGIASGIVISAFDEGQSAQQDIVIFDRRIIPPILFEQGPAIIPVESALICIEIKSKLTAVELRAAHTNALSVKNLSLHAGRRDQSGKWIEGRTSGPSILLLALDTDLTPGGESEIERVKTVLPGKHNWFSCICVVGRACLFPTEQVIYDRPTGTFFKEDHTPILGTWREVCADAEYAETLAFLSGVIQLIQRIGSARGTPPLDAYFSVEEDTTKRGIRLTSGDHTGKYVGKSESYECRDVESRGVGYSFYAQEERMFAFFPQAELGKYRLS